MLAMPSIPDIITDNTDTSDIPEADTGTSTVDTPGTPDEPMRTAYTVTHHAKAPRTGNSDIIAGLLVGVTVSIILGLLHINTGVSVIWAVTAGIMTLISVNHIRGWTELN